MHAGVDEGRLALLAGTTILFTELDFLVNKILLHIDKIKLNR